MSDYTKTTNFTAKDSLASGNASKLVKGSEFDTEFDALQTAVGTKANKITSGTNGAVIIQTAGGDLDDSLKTFASSDDIIDNFPAGTLMLFQQTAAPTGWTKETTHNDKIFRVVSGTASSGGTTAFSTWAAVAATNSHTLTTADIPAHSHSGTTASNGAHTHTVPNSDGTSGASYGLTINTSTSGTTTTSSNGAHTHTFTTDTDGGSGGGHTHAIDLDIQYVDIIIASKD